MPSQRPAVHVSAGCAERVAAARVAQCAMRQRAHLDVLDAVAALLLEDAMQRFAAELRTADLARVRALAAELAALHNGLDSPADTAPAACDIGLTARVGEVPACGASGRGGRSTTAAV